MQFFQVDLNLRDVEPFLRKKGCRWITLRFQLKFGFVYAILSYNTINDAYESMYRLVYQKADIFGLVEWGLHVFTRHHKENYVFVALNVVYKWTRLRTYQLNTQPFCGPRHVKWVFRKKMKEERSKIDVENYAFRSSAEEQNLFLNLSTSQEYHTT